MDFKGQELAERLYRWIIALFSFAGFVYSYITQEFRWSVYAIGAGFVVAVVVSAFNWPCYRRHPVAWLKEIPEQGRSTRHQQTPPQAAAAASPTPAAPATAPKPKGQ